MMTSCYLAFFSQIYDERLVNDTYSHSIHSCQFESELLCYLLIFLLPLFDSLRDQHHSYKAKPKGVHLRKSYCTQQFKCRKVLGSLRYTSQSNSSSYMYKVNNKHTLHSLPQHNLLEFLLFLYHSIPSHFLMLQLVAQLDQPLIISNNSRWVWNNIVASQMKKVFESQQSIPREHITNNLKVTLIWKYLHCTATFDTMHKAVWVSS